MSSEPQSARLSDEIKALEQTRQRLFQLNGALQSLHRDLSIHDPLPSWPGLHGAAHILSIHLQSLSAHLDSHRDILGAAHVYPLPSFPDRSHEIVMGQLLRKKLEPSVEDWVEEGRREASELDQKATPISDGVSKQERKFDQEQFQKLWEWATTDPLSQIGEIPWGIDYTMEERQREGGIESVVTGLNRKLTSEERQADDEDQDEDEQRNPQHAKPEAKATAAVPATPVEKALKFLVTGTSR